MAKILVNDEWYEEIGASAVYETHFENVLRHNAAKLFPGYHFVPFKMIVESEEDSARPDFALIDRTYRSWWVGEVELGDHSFAGHVLPQVRTLARASYTESEARYLCDQSADLELTRMVEMFKGKRPRVHVIVNVPRPEWVESLRANEAILSVVQIFRSFRNRHVFRVNGEAPTQNLSVLTTCEVEKMLHRFLWIHSPATLPVKTGEKMVLRYDNQVWEWDRSDTSDRVYLIASRSHTLVRGQLYEIVELEDRSYEIRASTQKKRK